MKNLAWGTPSDNNADQIRHGTWAHGERVNTAKLTRAQAIEVLLSGGSMASIGKRYGVTTQTVWNIKTGKTWKTLPRKGLVNQ